MARQYAPLYTTIWQSDFTKLSALSQRLYLLAVSQQNTSWCGVVSFTARRWATFAADTTPKQITKAVAELQEKGYVLLDEATEELWVRSFAKHNNVLSQPKLLAAAKRQFGEVHSQGIRMAIAKAYPGLGDAQGEGVEMPPVLGVDGEVSVEEEPLPTSHPTPSPEVLAEYRAEAEREADGWLKRQPGSIVSRSGWIEKRVVTLTRAHGAAGLPKDAVRQIRPVCPDADCRDGYNLAGSEPVACTVCGVHVRAS